MLQLRDKRAVVGWSVQNPITFVFTFTVPFFAQPGANSANLGPRVGFIYGSFGVAGAIWACFHFPELKSRSLEEIGEMLRHMVPARKTKSELCPHPHLGIFIIPLHQTLQFRVEKLSVLRVVLIMIGIERNALT